MKAQADRWKPWVMGGAVALAAAWLMRPAAPNFMRVPVSGSAPEWSFSDIDGRRYSATNFAGQVVVLNFWATWCPPCRRELPDLAAFHLANTHRGITVIGASIDESPQSTLRAFLKRQPIPYPVVVADPLSRDAFGGVSQIPETWIIGRDGRTVARYFGAVTRAELDRAVAPLLAGGRSLPVREIAAVVPRDVVKSGSSRPH